MCLLGVLLDLKGLEMISWDEGCIDEFKGKDLIDSWLKGAQREVLLH